MTRRSLAVLLTLCCGYILSQFYRSANSVIGPDLMRDLHLTPGELGIMTGTFFIVFTLCQIPVGLLIDRNGPKRTLLLTMIFAVAGSILFALGDSLLTLSIARALLGIGTSALLIAALVMFANWFPADRFATVSSIHFGLGSAGSLLATTPLALAASTIGWRGAFWFMAAVAIAYIAVFTLVVADAPTGQPTRSATGKDSVRQSLAGLREAINRPGFFRFFCLQLTFYSSNITVLGLWGGPYLNDIHGLDGPARGNVLLFMAIGSVLGYFVFGPMDRLFNTRKQIVFAGSGTIITVLGILALAPRLSVPQITALLTLQGLASGSVVMLMAHGRSIFPIHLLGRGMSSLNIATMGGAALMQILSGYIINQLTLPGEGTPEFAYRIVFGMLGGALLLALINYAQVPDSRPSDEHPAR